MIAVSVADLYLKAWLVLLIAILPPAGIGLFFLWPLLAMGWPIGEPMPMQIPVFTSLLCMPLALLVLTRRRRLMRLERPTQWLLALVGVGLFTLTFICLFLALN